MSELFSQILNMSLTASIVIAVVILARTCMRKLPKIFSYVLWSVVLFRLLCPVSISGPGSLLELLKPQVEETSDTVSVVSYLPIPEDLPEFQYVAAELPEEQFMYAREQLSAMDVFAWIWIAGVCAMGLYAGAQFLLLHKRLVGAVQHRGNVYLADHIDTAFVMGILFPKIYLPSHVPFSERKYILAHERHHIRRGDHVVKLLAYLALCMHWFNPLVWMAFILAGKDMEMSCDEAVIRKFGSHIRAEYSTSLLRLAVHRKPIPGMPLAFGEGDTKGRIRNMAKWKKPKLWVSILCGVLCIAVLAACALNPAQEDTVSNTEPVQETAGDGNAYAPFSDEYINILITGFLDEEAALPDMQLLLSIHPEFKTVTMGTLLKDTYVDIPDYQGHTVGDNRFVVCYALGRTWGGTEAAVEMVNQCILENFDITVDANMELSGTQYAGFMDVLKEILGQLDAPMSDDLQNVSNELLALIAGSDESGRLEAIREKLASAVWESCTIPFEGTYTAEERTIAGEKVGILIMNPDSVESQSGDNGAEYMPTIQGSDIVVNAELVQYGALKLVLPEGYSSYAKDNAVVLTKDGEDIGGIQCYNMPAMPFDISIDYLAAMGLPEAQMALDGEEPIAYMIESDIGGGMVANFFHELKPETLNVDHHFYMAGDLIYDLYYDENVLSDIQAEKFLKTVELNGAPIFSNQPEKENSLQLCRNALERIQAAAYQIAVNRTNQGSYALNSSSSTVYASQGDNWVSITHVPDDDSYHGYMNVQGSYYSNEGNGWDDGGAVHWYEDPYPDEVYVPWIANFQWNDTLVTYVDTIRESGKNTVMLRIDEPLPGYEDMSECYFVNVRFTEDGSFLEAHLSLDFVWENDISTVKISEAIITLDETAVDEFIQKEYIRAVQEG